MSALIPALWSLVKTSDGVKPRRPFLILESFLHDGQSYTSVVPIQTNRDRSYDGWTEVSRQHPVIDDKSVITLDFSVLRSGNILRPPDKIAHLPAKVAGAFVDNLRVTLGLRPRYPGHADYTWHLPPPSLRAEGGEDREQALALLKGFGWTPPRQGMIYEIPRASACRAPSRYVLAVSSDTFNTRFRYPNTLFVPLSKNPMGGLPVTLRSASDSSLPDPLYALPRALFVVRFRSDWFDACPRCTSGRAGYTRWRVRIADPLPNCLACDGAAILPHVAGIDLWPVPRATVTASCLDRIVTAVTDPLERSLS